MITKLWTRRLRKSLMVALCAIGCAWNINSAHAAQEARPPDATGLWRIMDGSSPDPISLVALSEKDGVLSGTVMRVMHSKQGENPVCLACKGDLKDKAIVGMTILWDLRREGQKLTWSGGSVLDPAIGQIYKCKVTLKDPDTLEVRGFIGISMLGRSQMWKRAKPSELTAPLSAPAVPKAK